MNSATWAPLAQADLARIDEFNAQHDRDFADRVARAAVAASAFLAHYPEAGPVFIGKKRKWRVPGTDYILIYRIVTDGIEILRAYHSRENWRRP